MLIDGLNRICNRGDSEGEYREDMAGSWDGYEEDTAGRPSEIYDGARGRNKLLNYGSGGR
jgi:hypothetical protein